jgi:hypothetical protein
MNLTIAILKPQWVPNCKTDNEIWRQFSGIYFESLQIFRQYVYKNSNIVLICYPPKRQYISTKLHGVITHKSVILLLSALRISNPTNFILVTRQISLVFILFWEDYGYEFLPTFP